MPHHSKQTGKKPQVAATYYAEVTVPGVPSELFKTFNKAHGFSDGIVNTLDPASGNLVAKPGADEEEFIKSFNKATRSLTVKLKVTIYKDGTKKVETV